MALTFNLPLHVFFYNYVKDDPAHFTLYKAPQRIPVCPSCFTKIDMGYDCIQCGGWACTQCVKDIGADSERAQRTCTACLSWD